MSFSSPMIRRRSRQRRYGSGTSPDALSEAFVRSATRQRSALLGEEAFGRRCQRFGRIDQSSADANSVFSADITPRMARGPSDVERGRPEVGRPEPGPRVRVAGSGRSPSIQRPPFGIIPASIGLGSNPYQVRDKQSGTASLRPGLVSAAHAGGAPVPQ